jgi:hypothetical protein
MTRISVQSDELREQPSQVKARRNAGSTTSGTVVSMRSNAMKRALAVVGTIAVVSVSGLLVNVGSAAADEKPRQCKDMPGHVVVIAGAGAAGGAAVAGPPGALVGGALGGIAGMAGGCETKVKGKAHPAPRDREYQGPR